MVTTGGVSISVMTAKRTGSGDDAVRATQTAPGGGAEVTDSTGRNGNGGDYVYELEGDESPSEAVLNVVAAVSNRTLTEFSPLAESVDPEALDALFEPGRVPPGITVEFEYEGYEVTVTPDEVNLRDRDGGYDRDHG